ncbi:DNA oxidative demethylase AlkB [Tunturiibacter lichenicola]|uniref:DNA oxidative demethylase AlkB n=1 Tax=Tunturiibacter lichenicola TaxID=2051959 RepID=UPI0021B1AE68|nr:DNA oxidative demethylase AlkB [Edaphobacter lichenicola]
MRTAAPLFKDDFKYAYPRDYLGPGTAILEGFALQYEALIQNALLEIADQSPFRHMTTPGGFRMSVAMTNCGALGWVTDRKGYRYDSVDPDTGSPWPAMPALFFQLAQRAANEAGFPEFAPEGCLINRYEPGAKLSLHQDKDELDFTAPIVSVSFGLPAMFVFGGDQRSDKTVRIPVVHGDVLVWGGPARKRYHGVLPLKKGVHPVFGGHRYNLTFRKAR